MTLTVGLSVNPQEPDWLELAREAERVGVDSIWMPEFWAYDAFTPLAAIAASTQRVRLATGIVQLGARTPAMLAMSAMSLQHISGGRFVLGIGTSGPQVMEGWHGVRVRPAGAQRTRETIEIIRMITAGERLSYSTARSTGFRCPAARGVAIRSRAEPCTSPSTSRRSGRRTSRLTGELADGWIGNSFFPETADVFFDRSRGGAAGRAVARPTSTSSSRSASSSPTTSRRPGAAMPTGYAFTFGAMGSRRQQLLQRRLRPAGLRRRRGRGAAAVARRRPGGRRRRVPIEIGLGTNLIGPPDVVRERLRVYRDSGVTTLRVSPVGGGLRDRVADLGVLVDLVNDANVTD